MFRLILITIAVTIFLTATIAYFAFQGESEVTYWQSDENKIEEKIILINNRELIVEIADEPHEQSLGLSGRKPLNDNQGMLFIFPQTGFYEFWMKDMEFSLDLIWIDENNNIIEITKNVSPTIFPKTFQPPSPIKYVLEVNAGWSDRNRTNAGDEMIMK